MAEKMEILINIGRFHVFPSLDANHFPTQNRPV